MSEVVVFFRTVRNQVQLVRLLEQQMKKMDPENLAFARRRLDRESRLLREMEKKAREYMDSTALCPEHYSFLLMYYLTGLSLTNTAEAIDRCHRQVRRYKRLFEHGKMIKETEEQNTHEAFVYARGISRDGGSRRGARSAAADDGGNPGSQGERQGCSARQEEQEGAADRGE